jgi:hypothetical protein
MKTAIILFGVIHRSLKYTIEGFRKHLVMPLSEIGTVDVYFHSWDMLSIASPRAGEFEVAIHPEDIFLHLPEATGQFSSQIEFDKSMDWDNLLRNNPFKNYIPDKEEHDSSLKNFIRSVESQKRAWEFFKSNKKSKYDIVIASRPDVRYVHDLVIPSINPNEIYVPAFHGWEGVNDRFALGGEEEVGIWFNKKDFVCEWIRSGEPGYSELMTAKWLISNKLLIKELNFVFQRIRATGEVQNKDVDLKPNSKKI